MQEIPVISVENLSFYYDGGPILEDVNLRLMEGDSVCIIGPNGGGKTTLIKLILGLLKPTRGRVRVFGQDPVRVRSRIGYMPQHQNIDPLFPATVKSIVLMGRLIGQSFGRYTRSDHEAAREALREVSMSELAGHSFALLSAGERQRVLIARALVGDPDLLLLDEPTATVDAAAEAKLLEKLGDLKHRMTIVMVSHDLGFVSRMVRTVVCVNRRVAVHPTNEVTGEVIADIYGTELRMVRHDHHLEGEEFQHD